MFVESEEITNPTSLMKDDVRHMVNYSVLCNCSLSDALSEIKVRKLSLGQDLYKNVLYFTVCVLTVYTLPKKVLVI